MADKLKLILSKIYPFLLFAAILLWWFFKDLWPREAMFSYGDRPPFAGSLSSGWHIFINSWQPQLPGVLLPVLNLYPLIEFLFIFLSFGNSLFAQKLFFLLAPLLSFLFVYWFLDKLKIKSGFAKFLAGLIFATNLVVLGEIVGGAPGSVLATAFLPLVFWYLYQSFLEQGKVSSVLLLAFFTFLAFIFSDHIIIFLVGLIFLCLLFNLYKKKCPWKIFSRNLLLFIVAFLLLVVSYIPLYWQLQQDFTGSMAAKSLFSDLVSSYAGFDFLSFISLGGGKFYPKIFGGPVWWGYFSYLVPILVLPGIVIGLKKQRNWTVFLLAVLLSIFAFIFMTKWGWLNSFYKALPILFRFRNAARLELLTGLCLAVYIAFGWEWFERRLKRKIDLLPFATIVLALWLLAIYPLTFGHVLTKEKIVPAHWHQIEQIVAERQSQSFGRTLYLPWDYDMQKRVLWQDNLVNGLFMGYGQYAQPSYLYFLTGLYELLATGDTKNLGSVLEMAKISTIVVDKHKSENSQGKITSGLIFATPQLTGDAEKIRERILTTGLYDVLRETDDYLILSTKKSHQIIDFYNDKNTFLVQQMENWLKVLADNGWDFVNKPFSLALSQGNEQNQEVLEQNKIILSDDFNQAPDSNKWLVGGTHTSKGKTFLGGKEASALTSKITIGPETIIEARLATLNPDGYGYFGLRDVAENGFAFDFTRETSSGAPKFDIIAKSGNKAFRATAGSRDDKEHLFKIIWQSEQIEFYLDGQSVGTFPIKLEAYLPLTFSAAIDQQLVLSSLKINRLKDNKIFWQKKETKPISDIDWQIEKDGLNRYRISLNNAPQNFIIVFNEPYAEGWQATSNGRSLNHLAANGIFNGFEIDNCRRCDIVIEYQPQKQRIFLLILNGLFIVIALGALLFIKEKRLKNE